MANDDTIYALATPSGVSGVAVIRVSGSKVNEITEVVCGAVKPRYGHLRELRDQDGSLIDQALVLSFPKPHSFTGEDVVEFQTHGSLAVIEALFKALSQFQGVRPAEAGEFTRRAFTNGKLDLTQVEGLADLLAAHSEQQRRASLHQFGGALSRLALLYREKLLRFLSLIEATLDFPDEDDVTDQALIEARSGIEALSLKLTSILADSQRGKVQRDGLVITLIGEPNAGKSSLLNYFAGEEMAIVSDIAGTTRDPVVCELIIKGVPVRMIDTAGLRESSDSIENEGMRRTRAWAERSDLVWHLQDLREPLPEKVTKSAWIIGTKADLFDKNLSYMHNISVKSGEGLENLTASLEAFVEQFVTGEPAVIVRERHQFLLKEVSEALGKALLFDFMRQTDLVAEEIRVSLRALGRLTGHVGVEEMLDKLFKEFCIGK